MSILDRMYGPIYRAAGARGIAADDLDRSPLHVVRMQFIDPDEEAGPESEDDYRRRVLEAIAAQDEGRELDHEPFDIRQLTGI